MDQMPLERASSLKIALAVWLLPWGGAAGALPSLQPKVHPYLAQASPGLTL